MSFLIDFAGNFAQSLKKTRKSQKKAKKNLSG